MARRNSETDIGIWLVFAVFVIMVLGSFYALPIWILANSDVRRLVGWVLPVAWMLGPLLVALGESDNRLVSRTSAVVGGVTALVVLVDFIVRDPFNGSRIAAEFVLGTLVGIFVYLPLSKGLSDKEDVWLRNTLSFLCAAVVTGVMYLVFRHW